jgi:hypothetical protein
MQRGTAVAQALPHPYLDQWLHTDCETVCSQTNAHSYPQRLAAMLHASSTIAKFFLCSLFSRPVFTAMQGRPVWARLSRFISLLGQAL